MKSDEPGREEESLVPDVATRYHTVHKSSVKRYIFSRVIPHARTRGVAVDPFTGRIRTKKALVLSSLPLRLLLRLCTKCEEECSKEWEDEMKEKEGKRRCGVMSFSKSDGNEMENSVRHW